jgi:hypothetical protein
MSKIGRVLEINQLDTVTPEVVEAARQAFVLGSSGGQVDRRPLAS